jgi:hypothetical protein
MVFDATRRRGVLFGGTASVPEAPSPVASGDTWEQFEQGASDAPQQPEPGRDVSGVVRDFFTRAPLPDVTLRVDGQPGLSAISDSEGRYAFARVAAAQSFLVVASRTGQLDTRNDVGPVGSRAVVADVFLVAPAGLAVQATAVGVSLTPGLGAIFVDLRDEAGEPRDGLPAANIGLQPIFDAVIEFDGPFFFGSSGLLDPVLTVATVFDGHSRAAFLNVPPAPFTLSITTVDEPPKTLTVELVVTTNGVTLTGR